MDPLRIELVIGFALLLLVAVPAVVVRILDAVARRTAGDPATRSASPSSVTVKPEQRATGRTCPYCKDALADDAVHIECATCATWHHATCFEENQGCAVYGCKEKRGVGRAERSG